MKTCSSILVAAVLVTSLLPRSSEAAPHWRAVLQNAQRHAATALEGALTRVEATAKQRTQIRQILGRAAAEALAMGSDALQLQDQLAAAVLAAEPNEEELERLEGDGVELLGRGAHLTRVAVVQAAAVLTAKQRAELLSMWRRWVRQVAGS